MLVPATLLIVEDDTGLADLYKHIFELEGLHVYIANSLDEARNRLDGTTTIDVCLTDIHIKGQNALDMILTHQSFERKAVEFILHSGDDRYRDSAATHKIAFAGKPISIEILISMVNDLIEQKRPA